MIFKKMMVDGALVVRWAPGSVIMRSSFNRSTKMDEVVKYVNDAVVASKMHDLVVGVMARMLSDSEARVIKAIEVHEAKSDERYKCICDRLTKIEEALGGKIKEDRLIDLLISGKVSVNAGSPSDTEKQAS